MARRRRQPENVETVGDPLLSRVRRCERRGQKRRAMLLLRDACYSHRDDPRLWTLYGVQCMRSGQVGDAEAALSHAVWLRTRSRQPRKAQAIRRLLEQLRVRAA